MGRAAYEASAAARAVFAQADAALDYPLSTLCFDGPADELRQTRRQQPAILTCSLALLAAHDERETPFEIAAVTGHSLGLFTALVVAGALAADEALRLVALRGELMQRASDERPGGMAAVLGLSDDDVEDICAAISGSGDLVVPANYNAPGQVVISGTAEGLARAAEGLKERGARKIMPLAVAGPFHSPLMRAAADALRPALMAASIRQPLYPVVANTAPWALCDAEAIRAELLAQLLAPVRWTDAVRYMASSGTSSFVDCGPSATLAGLVKRIVPEMPVLRLDEG